MNARLAFALVLILAAACSKTPDEPTFDNPFDPNGSAPGTGYGLEVISSGDQINMIWDNISGVHSYDAYWSDESDQLESMQKINDDPISATTPKVQFPHQSFIAEKTNWYRIVGREAVPNDDDSGDPPLVAGRSLEPSAPVALDIEAMVSPADGSPFTPTRFIELKILTGVADRVEVSNRASFEGSTVFSVTPAVADFVPWELATEVWEADSLRMVENRDELQIHFRTLMTGSVGPADSTGIQIRFTPTLSIERGVRAKPGELSMVDTLQVFSIGDVAGQTLQSVQRLKEIGNKEFELVEDITPPSLDDPVVVHWDPQVEDPVNNRIASTVKSDFGFEGIAILDLDYPESLGEPSIEIVGGSFTTSRDIEVMVTCDQAGYIALSEQPDFAGKVFVTWADMLDYQLEDYFGTRFLYAAFTNPLLAETRLTSTLVSLVSPPARERQ